MTAHGEIKDQSAHVGVDFRLGLETGKTGPTGLLDVNKMPQDIDTVILARQLVGQKFHLHNAWMRGARVPYSASNGGHFSQIRCSSSHNGQRDVYDKRMKEEEGIKK